MKEYLNLANFVTFWRIISSPFFFYYLSKGNDRIAFGIYIIAWLSDGLDGFIARAFKLRSKFGVYFDPVADKVFILTTYISLGIYHYIPLWFMGIILLKDVMTGLGTLLLMPFAGIIDVSPTPAGKGATFFQLTTAFVVLLVERANKTELKWYVWTLILITSFFTIIASLQYFMRGLRILKITFGEERNE